MRRCSAQRRCAAACSRRRGTRGSASGPVSRGGASWHSRQRNVANVCVATWHRRWQCNVAVQRGGASWQRSLAAQGATCIHARTCASDGAASRSAIDAAAPTERSGALSTHGVLRVLTWRQPDYSRGVHGAGGCAIEQAQAAERRDEHCCSHLRRYRRPVPLTPLHADGQSHLGRAEPAWAAPRTSEGSESGRRGTPSNQAYSCRRTAGYGRRYRYVLAAPRPSERRRSGRRFNSATAVRSAAAASAVPCRADEHVLRHGVPPCNVLLGFVGARSADERFHRRNY